MAKKEPKRRQNGGKMEPKITLFQKSAKCEFDTLFTIYKPHRDLQKTSLFRTLGRVKTRCAPCGASNAASVLQNGDSRRQKCPEWGPLGGQRVAKRLRMPPKCLQKIIKNRPRVQGCAPEVPKVPPSLPKSPFFIKILWKTYIYFLGYTP